ncbi:hypothetical protein L5D93_22225 [Paenibacillus thiaminolyticus]|nr:hypothetical protein [Paenibacillus thiaminolyticus]
MNWLWLAAPLSTICAIDRIEIPLPPFVAQNQYLPCRLLGALWLIFVAGRKELGRKELNEERAAPHS